MRSIAVTVLLVFVPLDHAEELASKHTGTAYDSMDKLLDKLVDKLFDRGLQAGSLHDTDLENTTLEKASGSLALHGANRPLTLQPGVHSRSRLQPFMSASPGRVVRARATETGYVDCDIESCNAQSEPFKSIDSGPKFEMTLAGLVQAGKIPEKLQVGLLDLHSSYKGALGKSTAIDDSDKEAAQCIASVAERVLTQFKEPYTFPSRHRRILEPFDYYSFGQRYIGNLINFDTSYVGHAERLIEMKKQIENGENVLIYANHQSEADPAVWAWLTDALAPSLAKEVYYIAGDRVVLDTFAKPFSMGRNLVCVHSKRHMDDDPDLKAAKMATNQKSVRELGTLFKEGGAVVWVAPSGGRDRKGDSGDYVVSDFDPSAVFLLKRMMEKSKKPGHVYPMAMASAEIMPPPSGVEKALGEKRVLDYHGVGISFGQEIDLAKIESISDKTEQAAALTKAAYSAVKELYTPLADVIYGKVKPTEEFSQPWKDN
eukprot:gnl/MRDRNA2_/MRDRNA2_119723_c0_seq1.p1 gnl/MRDRNA2_/MRDRNA2_119723_c0~~gnl/MRDRNA2_/MRDRNA2_119723_c0_seq1.p1  ORF type:complete len:486 (-),score=90.82 gnl/MRDRNA2_/MRDRNA2_119723_c0_seq1:133-1590(-)